MKTVAHYDIHYHQYLNQNGELTQALPEFAKPEVLQELYRHMTLTRVFDAKAVALQRTGKMGTFPSSLGQEAVSIGMAHALQKTDVFVPYYRDQGAMIMRGVKPAQIFAYWGGDERGSDFADSREDFPICVPIASQCLHAAGVAYAIKLRKQTRAVLTICGDGGTSEGDFYEAINFAGTFHLPIVFIVNNNQWAISVPRGKQSACKTLAQKAVAGGFNGIQVDGNDVIAVRETVAQALNNARNGNGPTLIEAINYRLCDHTTADDAKRYSSKDELDAAWQNEPLLRLRSYLEKQNLWTPTQEEQLQTACSQQIAEAVEEYLNMPPQPATAMFDFLYDELPTAYNEQYAEVAELKMPLETH